MSKYVKTDQPGLYRDTDSNAIVVSRPNELKQYRERRAAFAETAERLESIDDLKNEVQELKDLVQRMLNKDAN